jgi:hypothetical protein
MEVNVGVGCLSEDYPKGASSCTPLKLVTRAGTAGLVFRSSYVINTAPYSHNPRSQVSEMFSPIEALSGLHVLRRSNVLTPWESETLTAVAKSP